jgi:hypothetical protein
MKKTNYLLLVIFLLLLSCESKQKNPFEGAWELTSAKWTFADTTKFPNSEHDREVKIFSEKNFIFIRQDTTNDDLFFAGGGTYTFKDNKYMETIESVSWSGGIGNTSTYECKFDDDLFIIEGPLNPQGELNPQWMLHEEWERIK